MILLCVYPSYWSHITYIDSMYLLVSKWTYSSYSNQQVAPQAAKTMSPPFAPMGGFGGGSSNSFSQMPTGAAPTPTSGANYPPINARASLNTNGYGKLCAFMCESMSVLYWCILSPLCILPQMALSLGHSSPLEQQRQCGPSGKASSTHRVMQSSTLMLRATSKTCFLWVIQALSLSQALFFCLPLSLKIFFLSL